MGLDHAIIRIIATLDAIEKACVTVATETKALRRTIEAWLQLAVSARAANNRNLDFLETGIPNGANPPPPARRADDWSDVNSVKAILRNYMLAFRDEGPDKVGELLIRVGRADRFADVPSEQWAELVHAARVEALAAGKYIG